MRLKLKSSLVALVLMVGAGFLSNCAGDEEVPEPVSEVSAEDEPAAPPPVDDALGGGGGAGNTIYFAFDDYSLSAEAQGTLQAIADQLKANPGSLVQIEGHCDERGSIEYNLALGERRAQSVKEYIVQLGVDASRLTTISYGEEKPAMEGHDEEAWSKNRRAEFIISGQ